MVAYFKRIFQLIRLAFIFGKGKGLGLVWEFFLEEQTLTRRSLLSGVSLSWAGTTAVPRTLAVMLVTPVTISVRYSFLSLRHSLSGFTWAANVDLLRSFSSSLSWVIFAC